jgi:NADH dehydrogenase
VIASGVFGLTTLGALWRQFGGPRVRILAVATVVSVLLGWGAAQYPYILPTTLTIDQAAAPGSVLLWLVIVFIIGAVIVAPALLMLWVLDQRSRLDEGAEGGAGERHRVVIIGGGFGGLFATKALAMAPVDVTLVDRHNYHLFQPLLYQVSTGILSEGQIGPPLRDVTRNARNCRIDLAEVTGFDLDKRIVSARNPIGRRMEIPYDSLIVAAGGRTSYFGNDQFEPFAPGMKTIDDALELRRRIFGAFELAELEDDPEEKRRWLTFVVVGAGPTGCELAGQIRELAARSLRHNFRTIDPTTAKVLLVDGGEKPLAGFGENLSGKGRKELEHMGVELRMGLRATDVDFNGLEVKTPDGTERIHAHTVIWAAGVAASPLAKMLGDASGAEVDRSGRVSVLPDCTVAGHPEVFAIGDMMSLDHLPGVAEVAMQQGLFAGRTIRRRLQGGGDKTVAFKYVDLGSMATIGRFRAVVEFKGIRLSGFAGWLMWLAVHLVFLTGFRNRLGALFRWTGALLGRHREERAFTVRRASTGDDSYASVMPSNIDDQRT